MRHVLGISGGKDSAALAVYMRDKVPQMEYFFCDTDKELPETYEFLSRLEAYLGKRIERLASRKGFDHWLKVYGGYLPSPSMRWCTRMMKLKPLEDWIGEEPTTSYVAIRADENRVGYVSTKPNISTVFPFRDAGLGHEDIVRILDDASIGLPSYYEWRSRSGCYFCFFQRKSEWAALRRRHPDLFELAAAYEKDAEEGASAFTWIADGRLADVIAKWEAEHGEPVGAPVRGKPGARTLMEILGDTEQEEGCSVCHL